jgi:tRNA/rRNA methyltransferase
MSNFGFTRLRVVHPYSPVYREARSAVGASHVLKDAEEYSSVAEAVADCSLVVGTTAAARRELHHPLKRLEYGGRLIRKQLGGSRRVALLFGSEKKGLSNEDFSHCHWLMHIPTCEENVSMNLGQAVAVCLYELVRDAKAPAQPDKEAPATAGDVERINAMLTEVLHASGYLSRRSSKDSADRIRRLVRRLKLPARDVSYWLGILRQIAWKLGTRKDVAPLMS